MDDRAIGQFLSDSSVRTGRRFRQDTWTGPTFIIRGRTYIRKSDLLQWLEGQKLERVERKQDLKSVLREISDKVLKQRQRRKGIA
jgi:hypothetical protein